MLFRGILMSKSNWNWTSEVNMTSPPSFSVILVNVGLRSNLVGNRSQYKSNLIWTWHHDTFPHPPSFPLTSNSSAATLTQRSHLSLNQARTELDGWCGRGKVISHIRKRNWFYFSCSVTCNLVFIHLLFFSSSLHNSLSVLGNPLCNFYWWIQVKQNLKELFTDR